VVVESVAKNSEGEKAGLAGGNVILSWTRGDVKGEIESPFDLSEIEMEQEPLGRVTLQGETGQTWVIGPDKWGVQARPNFAGNLLRVYRQGQELANAGKLDEATARWRKAANDHGSSRCSWIGPWLLFHAAQTLADKQRWKESDAFYQGAVERAQSAETRIRVQLQQAWAESFRLQGDGDNAEKHYLLALNESRQLRSDSGFVDRSLTGLGLIAQDRGDLDKAEDYFQQALAIREKVVPGSLDVARCLNHLGNIADDRGDLDKAREYYLQALEIEKNLAPDGLDVGNSLNNLGNVAYYRGDLDQAGEYYRAGLEIRKKLAPGSLDVAGSLNNLGNVATDRGDLARGEEYQRQALEILTKVAPATRALVLNNLGEVALDRGDLVRAEEYCRQALEIQKKLAPVSLDAAVSLLNLCEVARKRTDLARAEEYCRQAQEILEKVAPASREEAANLINLGEVAHERSDLDKAERYQHQGREILEKVAPGSLDLAASLINLGEVAREKHELAKASEYYAQALEIRTKLAPASAGTAESLAGLAGIMRDQQQGEQAARLYSEAIDVLESQLAHLGGSGDIRAGFRAKHADYYSAYADLLLAQKQPEVAFQVLERSRARTLLETLTEAHVDIRQGADPYLLEQERALQVKLTAKSNRKINLLQGNHTDEQVAAINKEIDDYLRQYQEVEGQIRTSSPNYAALTQPRPLSAREIQQQLLDTDTVLLEYSLGEKRSFVFVLTPVSLDSYELPKRSEIEDTARHVYDLLTERNRWIKGETVSQRKQRIAQREAEYRKAAATLSRMILGPASARLEGKRLLIVADGALQYVPFAALPVPSSNASKPEVVMVAEHEIVNLPSASVLALLRRQANARGAAPMEVAVLADPVFDKDDSRVGKARKTKQAVVHASETKIIPQFPYQLSRSLDDIRPDASGGDFALPRLSFSRQEADAIMATTSRGKGMVALDFDASRDTALSKDLGRYRIVHFATHGLFDNTHPELSGLVLSLVDREGKSRDGFLDLEDVYNLTLPADLVVLSACETGLGKQIVGEGLVGLTRGFMYAGATRVVASLWKVDDVATADLMGRFYRGMLKDGLRPTAALRQAQIEMQKQKRWSDPYYWAAFTVEGEWK